MNKFLLPPGFRDLLFDEAEREFFATTSIINKFYDSGYRLVSTPLVEYEDSLFHGAGKSLEGKTLRLFDPHSQKTMGIRSDITPQISRLVESRLADQKLPLKLCYYGNILRSAPANTRGDRQLRQIGIELIDKAPSPASDAEVIHIVAEALQGLGLGKLTIDLNAPNFITSIAEINEETKRAITKREFAKLPANLAEIVSAAGDAENALKLDRKNLPKAAAEQIDYLKDVYNELKKSKTPANITVDYAENRGFEYHKLVSFSVFAENVRDELGRGGRYEIGKLSATGFTLYLNSFLDKITKTNG